MLNKILSLLLPLLLPWLVAWLIDRLSSRRRRSPFDNAKVIDVSETPRPWWARRRTLILCSISLLLLILSLGYAAETGVRF